MKLSQVAFVFRRVFHSFREVLWTHILTSGTMAMTLFIFGGFLLIQENLEGLVRGWGSRIQIFAYLENNLAAVEIDPLVSRVRAYAEVESARFVSQREAWDSFKKSLGAGSGVLEGLSADALPASLEIALRASYRDHDSLSGVAGRLRTEKGIAEVEYPQEWMEKFSVLVLGIEWAKWILGGFLFLATLLIVGNTVKLAILARREEIEIMRLVGAPSMVIRMPFLIEGMIQGIFGAALSLLFLWLLFLALKSQLPLTPEIFMDRSQFRFLAPESAALLILLGWAMGAFGSFFFPGAVSSEMVTTAKIRLAVAFLLLALFPRLPARAAEAVRELEGIKKKIERERQGITTVKKKEGSVLESLGKIDGELDKKNKELKKINGALDSILADIKKKEAEARKIDSSIDVRKDLLRRRAAALYKWRRTGSPFVLLNGVGSVGELMQRRHYLSVTLGYDRALVDRLSDESERQQALKKELEEKKEEMGRQKKALTNIKESIRQDKQKKQEVLASLRREKETRQRALKELEQAALRLQKMMDEISRRSAALPKESPSGTGFEAMRGRLEYPARGAVTSGFGKTQHPEFSAELFRKGIDIDAPLGEEVRAVEAGKIVFADRFSGYGKMMIIDHGQRYYTIYAHLADLFKKTGDPVRKGEPIALVGDSDSLAGARLYFEIRKDGKPVDPAPWFRK